MKLIAFIALLASLCPLFAADHSKKATDPFAGTFFPPELVLLAQDRIALTPAQLAAVHARVEMMRQRSDELRVRMEHEVAALTALIKQERVEEAALLAQLDKLLDVEREVKHLQVGSAVAIKNLLTPEQQAKLRELSQDHEALTKLKEEVSKRLTEKVERVQEGAQKMAEGGRDPSDVLRSFQEKFKPLMDAGKAFEAEAVLDDTLKLFMQDASPAPESPKEERKASSTQAAASALEQVATGFRLAEGPAWDGENLIFSDVFPSKIHKLSSDGTVCMIRSETRKGAGMAFDSKGRLLICEVDGFRVTRIEKDGSEKTLAESYEGKKLNGPNDLAVDAKDGIYFTDPLFLNKDKREQDKEAVYYISPEGKLLRVADDIEKPNGIALTGEGKTLFVADSAKGKLRAYPVKEDGTLGEGRDFGTVPSPDGVRVDMDGRVYAAGKTGIAIWDANEKFLGTLATPAAPNSLTFGGADQRTMFVTTNASVLKIGIDKALKLVKTGEPVIAKAEYAPTASAETVQQRVAAKIERVKAGATQLAQSGTDPSTILQIMKEKVGPLLGEGKFAEAEPEVDRVLAQLNQASK